MSSYEIPVDVDGRLNLCSLSYPNLLTDADATAAFKAALYKTKGKSNSKFAAALALAGATSDEIVKFMTRIRIDYYGGFIYKPRQCKLVKEQRAAKRVIKAVPNFWDTVKGRTMRALVGDRALKMAGVDPAQPLPVAKLDVSLSQHYINCVAGSVGNTAKCYSDMESLRYSSDTKRALQVAMCFGALANVRFYKADEVLPALMSSSERVSQRIPEYETYRKYEIDSFVHMDEEVVSKIQPDELLVDCLNNDIGYMYAVTAPDYIKKRAIDYQCVFETFYFACQEMGIVGIGNRNLSYARVYVSRAALQGIMKHVIKMSGVYRRLVKSGFAESVARTTVLEEINNAIQNRQGRPYIRFYPRNDYPDTPLEEKTQPKKKVSTYSGGKRVVKTSLEGFGGATTTKESEGEDE